MYNFKQTFVVRNKDYPASRQAAAVGAQRSQSDWDLAHHHQREPSSVQLVPLMDRSIESGRRSEASEPDERLRGLETRLKVAEKSNKALLDEVVRLQTELKSVSRRGEDALREERKARQMLESSLRSSNDLVNQLAQRIRSQEEKLQEERSILENLSNQTRSVEQEVSAKKDSQMSRISALERDLENMTRAKAQLERVSAKLVDEMRGLKAKLEEAGNFQEKSKRLEAVQQKLEQAGEVYQQSQQLQVKLQSALDELRHLVSDLRSRLKQESAERQQLEQKMGAKMSELHRSLGEQVRKREDSTKQQEVQQHERDRLMESDWLALQAKIQEAVEQLNQKILEKEVKLREDAARNQAESEKMLLREQESRLTQEREARRQQEERWDAMRRAQEEQLEQLRRLHRGELSESAEAVRKVHEALEQTEHRLHDSLKGVSTLIQEEVASRKSQDVEFTTRFRTVEEEAAASAESLAKEIAALEQRLRGLPTADKGNLEELLEDYRRDTSNKISEVETQIRNFRQQLDRLDAKIDGQASASLQQHESSDAQLRALADKVDSLAAWKLTAATQISDLTDKQKAANDRADAQSLEVATVKESVRVQVGEEIAGRVQDIDQIRNELQLLKDSIPSADDGSLKKELEECQSLVRKLAEVVQTVKTVLGMKIQSEQKLRLEEMKSVQDAMTEQKARVDDLAVKVDNPPKKGKKA